MKTHSTKNIQARIDAVLPFSGTLAQWAEKIGTTDEAVVGRALKHFNTSHTSDKGKRILTHVKTERAGVWTVRRHSLGYAEAYVTHK